MEPLSSSSPSQPAGVFRSIQTEALCTAGLLGIVLAVAVRGLIAGFEGMELLSRVETGSVSPADLWHLESRQQWNALLQVAVNLVAGVVFLVWFYRAHRNLPALGNHDLTYTPRWAVGAFLVPILNLIRPAEVMAEVYRGSDPAGVDRDAAAQGTSVGARSGAPVLVAAWWTLFLLGGPVMGLLSRYGISEEADLAALQAISTVLVLGQVFYVIAAFLAIALVGRITVWQEQRAERLEQVEGAPPPVAAKSEARPG